MMTINSELALHTAWKSNCVVYCLTHTWCISLGAGRSSSVHWFIAVFYCCFGGRCVLTSKLHTSAKTLRQDQFILCDAECVREKISETHTHTHRL